MLRAEAVEFGGKYRWAIVSRPSPDDQPSPELGLRSRVSRTIVMGGGDGTHSYSQALQAGEARLRIINRVKRSLEMS